MNKENENILMLKKLLDISNSCKFIKEENTNDNLLKIKPFYNNNMCIYINFNELILLLENYSGIDYVLSSNLDKEQDNKNINKNKIKNVLLDLWQKNELYEHIIQDLRSLQTSQEITEEEYNYIIKNYDILLELYYQ